MMEDKNPILVIAVVLLITGVVAYSFQGLTTEGTVYVEEPENNTGDNTGDTSNQEAVTFTEGRTERTSDFDGETLNPGDTFTDDFTLVNNRESSTDVIVTPETGSSITANVLYDGTDGNSFEVSDETEAEIVYTVDEQLEGSELGETNVGASVGYGE